MATRTNSKSKTVVVASSKSARVRSLLTNGSSIADAARTVGIGYAFAYGVAQRAGLAETAAKRRPEANSRVCAAMRFVQPTWNAAKISAAAAAFVTGASLPTPKAAAKSTTKSTPKPPVVAVLAS